MAGRRGNGGLTHGQMEDQLTVLSRELLRRLTRTRWTCGRRGSSAGAGDRLGRGKAGSWNLAGPGPGTVFGQVTVNRMAYRHRGGRTFTRWTRS